MIRRTTDASEINPILNDPAIRRMIAVAGVDEIDVQPVIDDPRNILLMGEGGGVIFCQQEPGIYEVHTNFLENYRGLNALRTSREAYRWMFLHTDCMVLQTRVPAFNQAADKFCRLVGATHEFTRKGAWRGADGPSDLAFWSLRYEDWVRRETSFKAAGKAFHARFDAELKRHKVTEPNHDDDDCHDLYVGACVEMIYAGQVEKAVVLYNRVARFANFGGITLVSREPLLLDVGTALIQVLDHDFKVIRFHASH